MNGDPQPSRYRWLAGEGLGAQLARGGLGSVVLKLLSAGIALSITVLLARSLGPAGYGVYAYVLALVTLMAIPAEFGLPSLVVRETARAQVGRRWDLIRGMWRWAILAAATLSLGVAVVAGGLAWVLSERFTGLQLTTFAWGLLLLPLVALGNLVGAALRGLRRVLQGQLPELVLRPAGFLLLIAGVLIFGGPRLGADTAMALHAGAAAGAFAIGAWLLARGRPRPVAQATPAYETRRWAGSAVPLALVAGMHLIHQQTDIVILGLFAASGEVGVYRVAAQAAAFVGFGLNAINMVVAPQFARLHAQGDRAGLQWMARFSARIVLLLTLPVVAVLVALGGPILEWVFGPEYGAGYLALAILAVGQLFNAAFGSVGFLLNMTGHERDTARGMAIAVTVNVGLNLLLIPPFGIAGAATATALTLGLWNLLLWRAVHRRLGIDSTALRSPAVPLRH